jgi:RNA ligase (TIGR02306 family)
LSPIEGADRLEVARVLGWHVVVQKGLYAEGDLVVYCEVDSVLPDRPEFEFLGKNKRIRTMKLRGQVSQGICFPVHELKQLLVKPLYHEGDDVTEELGVTKYEPPIPANIAGEMLGAFPSFIPKTDEIRVQSLEDWIERFSGEKWSTTEKVDGTSATFYVHESHFGVCSRNIELKENADNTLWQAARKYGIEGILHSLGFSVAIQGEIIGDGIQGNKYRLGKNERRFLLFSVFDIRAYRYFTPEEVSDFCRQFGFESVPVLGMTPIVSVDQLVEASIGKSVLADVQREGIVLRPLDGRSLNGERVSMKAINPKFLLKYEE